MIAIVPFGSMSSPNVSMTRIGLNENSAAIALAQAARRPDQKNLRVL
jgi:hypothetical protein